MDFIGQLQGYDPLRSLGGVSSALGQLLGQTQVQGKIDSLTNEVFGGRQQRQLQQPAGPTGSSSPVSADPEVDIDALYTQANRYRDLADKVGSIAGTNSPYYKSLDRRAQQLEREAKQAEARKKRTDADQKAQREAQLKEKKRAAELQALEEGVPEQIDTVSEDVLDDGEAVEADVTAETGPQPLTARQRRDRAEKIYKETDDPEVKQKALVAAEEAQTEIDNENRRIILENSGAATSEIDPLMNAISSPALQKIVDDLLGSRLKDAEGYGPEEIETMREELKKVTPESQHPTIDAMGPKEIVDAIKKTVRPAGGEGVKRRVAEILDPQIAEEWDTLDSDMQKSILEATNKRAEANNVRNSNRLAELDEERSTLESEARGIDVLGRSNTTNSILENTLSKLWKVPNLQSIETLQGKAALASQMVDNRKKFGTQISDKDIEFMMEQVPNYLTTKDKREAINAILKKENDIKRANVRLEQRIVRDNPDLSAMGIGKLVEESRLKDPEIQKANRDYAITVERNKPLRQHHMRYISSQLTDEDIKELKSAGRVPALAPSQEGLLEVVSIPEGEKARTEALKRGFIVGKI